MCCICLSSNDIHGFSVHLKKYYLSLLSSSHFYEWDAHVTDILKKHEIFQMKPQANCSHYGSVNAFQILPHRRNLISSFGVYYAVCLQMFFPLPLFKFPFPLFKSYSAGIILKPSNNLHNNEKLLKENFHFFQGSQEKLCLILPREKFCRCEQYSKIIKTAKYKIK